ncbi:hypothetical protein I7I48_02713 [Histoplasma ohiense]|nr:hypothetical protein I7I48_02713 [Histoplasma ohiense (nom. inval.)]
MLPLLGTQAPPHPMNRLPRPKYNSLFLSFPSFSFSSFFFLKSSGSKKDHMPMSRHSAPLQGGFYSNFLLSKESSYHVCRACEQQLF